MRRNTKKIAPMICTVVILAILALYLGAILVAVSGESETWAIAFTVIVVGGVVAAIAVGILIALRQRLREIDSGEEDEARIY